MSNVGKILPLLGIAAIMALVFLFMRPRQKEVPKAANPTTQNDTAVTESQTSPEILLANLKPVQKVCAYKLEMQQLQKAFDYTNPSCRNLAVKLAGKSPGKYNLGQICKIYDHCLKNWKYVDDPRSLEYLSAASSTLEAEYSGDCDDFAILVGSLISSVGGDVRIQKAYKQTEGHSYCEVNMGMTPKEVVEKYLIDRYPNANSRKDIHLRDDETGLWLNLDWSAGFPGGEYFNADRSIAFHIQDGYCKQYE